ASAFPKRRAEWTGETQVLPDLRTALSSLRLRAGSGCGMQVFPRLSWQADDIKLDRFPETASWTDRRHTRANPILRTAPSPLRAALSAGGSAGISGFPASGRLPMIVLTKPSGPLLEGAAAR